MITIDEASETGELLIVAAFLLITDADRALALDIVKVVVPAVGAWGAARMADRREKSMKERDSWREMTTQARDLMDKLQAQTDHAEKRAEEAESKVKEAESKAKEMESKAEEAEKRALRAEERSRDLQRELSRALAELRKGSAGAPPQMPDFDGS